MALWHARGPGRSLLSPFKNNALPPTTPAKVHRTPGSTAVPPATQPPWCARAARTDSSSAATSADHEPRGRTGHSVRPAGFGEGSGVRCGLCPLTPARATRNVWAGDVVVSGRAAALGAPRVRRQPWGRTAGTADLRRLPAIGPLCRSRRLPGGAPSSTSCLSLVAGRALRRSSSGAGRAAAVQETNRCPRGECGQPTKCGSRGDGMSGAGPGCRVGTARPSALAPPGVSSDDAVQTLCDDLAHLASRMANLIP